MGTTFLPHRILIAISCYLLSGYSLIAPIGIARQHTYLFGLMVFAWLAHFAMTYGWIKDRRVSRFWPVLGTVAGLASLTWGPISLNSLEDFGTSLLISWMFSVPFSLPCILLAVYLVWFHCKPKATTLQQD